MARWVDPGVAVVLITLIASVLIHRYVERPLEKKRASVSQGATIDPSGEKVNVTPVPQAASS
jgi:peptidoglycan/LPS O-acetylase OafA/YrhL